MPTHQTRERLEELRTPDGRIYLGCAAVGTSPAWMQGAFGAAWDVVDRVHRRAMASGGGYQLSVFQGEFRVAPADARGG